MGRRGEQNNQGLGRMGGQDDRGGWLAGRRGERSVKEGGQQQGRGEAKAAAAAGGLQADGESSGERLPNPCLPLPAGA